MGAMIGWYLYLGTIERANRQLRHSPRLLLPRSLRILHHRPLSTMLCAFVVMPQAAEGGAGVLLECVCFGARGARHVHSNDL